MTDIVVGDTQTVPVKSKWTSKTNITGALIFLFGLLTAFGKLPASLAGPEVAGTVVAAGGVLVTFFRTIAKSVLA